MTSSQYNNIIQWTLSNQLPDKQDKFVSTAKKIFNGCGVEFPSGNGEAVRAVLKDNDYIAWRGCTAEEAQQYANEGKAAIGICGEQIIVIKPEEEWVPIKSVFEDAPAERGLADTVSGMDAEELENTVFFAYSAYGTGIPVLEPLIFVKVESSPGTLTESEKGVNAMHIFNYLLHRGFTKQAACGVLGNMEQECGMNPAVWQVWHNTKYGYGLAQWSPATDFLNWAAEQGYIAQATAGYIDNLAIREPLRLMYAELIYLVDYYSDRWYTPETFKRKNFAGKSMANFADFKKSTLDVFTLAIIFHDHYERSSDDESEVKKRGVYAQKWAQFFDI